MNDREDFLVFCMFAFCRQGGKSIIGTFRSFAKNLLCGLMVPLLAGTALAAQDAPAKLGWHVGAYVSVIASDSTPDFAIEAYDGTIRTSDVADGNGWSCGLFAERHFSKRVSARFGLDYAQLGGMSVDYWLYTKGYRLEEMSLNLDVKLYLNGYSSGEHPQFSIFGGLGGYSKYIDECLWGEHMRSYDVVSGFSSSLGAGVYVSRHIGLELRSVFSNAPLIQLSLIFRS